MHFFARRFVVPLGGCVRFAPIVFRRGVTKGKATMKTKLLALLAATILTSAFGQTTPPNLTNGLVAFYPFEGNANDVSGSGNNATAAGNFLYLTNGLSDGAIRIIGDNSQYFAGGGHVMLPNLGSNMNTAFTCSLWVKDEVPGTGPSDAEFYVTFQKAEGQSPGTYVSLNNWLPPFFAFNLGDGVNPGVGTWVYLSSIPTHASVWKQIAFVLTPNRYSCYSNGNKVFETNSSPSIFPTAVAALGRHWWQPGDSSARMSCTYDTVRIWNRSLTDQEVRQLYNYDQGISTLDVRVKTLRVTMNMELGKNYQIESSTNLPTWFNYGVPFVATNTPIYQDVEVDAGPQFFRLRRLP